MDTQLKVIVEGSLYNEFGKLTQHFIKHNLITTKGLAFLCNCFGNYTRPAPMRYIAVGTSSTAPALSNTALGNEIERKESDFKFTEGNSFLTTSITLLPDEGTGALTEAGIFNSSGVLFDRVTFPVINKGALDTFVISFRLTFKETTG